MPPSRFPPPTYPPGYTPSSRTRVVGSYESHYAKRNLSINIPFIKILATGFNPMDVQRDIVKEMERAFKESPHFKRLAAYIRYLPEDHIGESQGSIPPLRCTDTTPKGIADCLAEWVGERLVSTVGDYFLTQAEEKYHIQEAMADYHALYPPYNPLPRLTPEQIDALNSRPLPKFEDMLEDIYRGMEANGYDVRNAWASRLLEATMLPSKPLPTASEPAPDAPMDAVLLSADVPPEMIRMAADVEAAANGPETSQPESVQPPVTKETKEEDSGIWSYTKKVGSFLWGFMDGAAERTRPTSDAIHHILMKPERFVVETGKGLLKLANDFTGYVMYYLPGGQVFTEKHRSAVAVSHAVYMGIVDFLKQGQKHFIDFFEAENTEDRGSAVGKITHDTLAIWLMFRSLFSKSVSPGKKRTPRPDKTRDSKPIREGAGSNKPAKTSKAWDISKTTNHETGVSGISQNYRNIINSRDFKLGKAGDAAAARRIVDKLWTTKQTADLKAKLGRRKETIFMSVPSTTGKNVIPDALAQRLSKELQGMYVDVQTLYKSTSPRTMRSVEPALRPFEERSYSLLNPKALDNLKGKQVVITEDVITTGSSLRQFAIQLRRDGINVHTVASLMGNPQLDASSKLIQTLNATLIDAKLSLDANKLAQAFSAGEIRAIIRLISEGGSSSYIAQIAGKIQEIYSRRIAR